MLAQELIAKNNENLIQISLSRLIEIKNTK